ncbi:MAG TPA: homoserine dehydrogenase, partial [Chromatiaceae bacterium]|nr:homoserine dehydrogenase [Chromatiaceae bacterium]
MSREVRILLVGVGNLGRRFCRILVEKSDLVEKRYGLKLILVGIADSKGIATSAEGLDPGLVAEIKEQGGSVS